MHLNVCELVKLLAGFLQYNGGKVEEAEDFQVWFRRLPFVQMEIDQL